jgi:hypothetical protein
MQTAFDQFENNMSYVKELDSLYIYLTDVLMLPNDLSDILRAEWIYSVSALDKLIHELIRIGMMETFRGTRVPTAKFQAFNISVATLNNIKNSTGTSIPPGEYYFEQEIVQKHSYLSFQEPDKINEGLSLIWAHNYKWQHLAAETGINPEATLKTRLKTIISRRNQMVHEADINPTTGKRNDISKVDADSVVTFIELLATKIFDSVK